MKVYTRTGDKGYTGIHGGGRVPKDDTRIAAVGSIDELNAFIGRLRSAIPDNDERQGLLFRIQRDLMTVMSLVATPSDIRHQNPNILPENPAAYCEEYIDVVLARLPENGFFILPGGTPFSADCHICRVVARRAERELQALHRTDEIPADILGYINRLSDVFFVMARADMYDAELPEERWHSFTYKSKLRKRREEVK